MLSKKEISVLRTFRTYLISPGKMLCFFGPNLEKHRNALNSLTERQFLIKERFTGAYSLTQEGFDAMKACEA